MSEIKLHAVVDGGISVSPRNEIRVVVDFGDGQGVEIVHTHEGMIVNCTKDGEITDGTQWKTWEEVFDDSHKC